MKLKYVLIAFVLNYACYSQHQRSGGVQGGVYNCNSSINSLFGCNFNYSCSYFNAEIRTNCVFQNSKYGPSGTNYCSENIKPFYTILPSIGFTTKKNKIISFDIKVGLIFYKFNTNYNCVVNVYSQLRPAIITGFEIKPFKDKRFIFRPFFELSTLEYTYDNDKYISTANVFKYGIGINYAFIKNKKAAVIAK